MGSTPVLHQQSKPETTWSRVNIAESIVGVQTPLSWSVWDVGGEMGFRHGYRALGLLPRSAMAIPDSIDEQYTAIFYGQGACNIDTFLATLAAMPGSGGAAEEGFFATKSGGRGFLGTKWRRYLVQAWFPVAQFLLPFRMRRLRRTSAEFWRETTAPGAVTDIDQARAHLVEAIDRFGPAVGMQIVASTFTGIYYGKIQALLAEIERPDLELHLIGGYGSMQEVRVTEDLWQIARKGGGLDDFLAEHGFHGPTEGELSSHSWREDPAPIAAMLAKFRSMPDGADPVAAGRHQASERKSAERTVITARSGAARAKARWTLALSRRYIPLRVEAKAAFMQVFDTARAATRAIGEAWVAEGRLDATDDVYYLTLDDLLGPTPDDLRSLVEERRHERESYLGLELPINWVGMPEPMETPPPLADDTPSPGVLTALGVSPGIVEGTARVLLDPNDPDALEPGEILVCHTTDPSWSSYFFVASAVVIDIGGALSHGAIVARELGIPCVINTVDGTRTIRSGDQLRVDGTAGTVEVMART